jgi:hypothetical protein
LPLAAEKSAGLASVGALDDALALPPAAATEEDRWDIPTFLRKQVGE